MKCQRKALGGVNLRAKLRLDPALPSAKGQPQIAGLGTRSLELDSRTDPAHLITIISSSFSAGIVNVLPLDRVMPW